MVRAILVFLLLSFFLSCTVSKTLPAPEYSYIPQSPELHDTIVELDSILFHAYNTGGLAVFDSLFSDNVEFYHDQGGLSTSKPQLLEALKNNVFGKVTRHLLPGSIEVYPIPGFGAVQMGLHKFHNSSEPDNSNARYSKFVHIWKKEPDGWKISRVVSLH